MTVEKRRELIRYATDAARAVLAEGQPPGKRDFCCAAVALLQDFLHANGIASKKWAVRVVLINDVLWKWCGGDLDRAIYSTEEPKPEGGFAKGVGFKHPKDVDPAYFPGHMVVTTRNPDMLLDPTVNQFEVPERGVRMEGACCEEVPREMLRHFERGDGAIVGLLDPTDEDTLGAGAIAWLPAPDLDARFGMGWDDAVLREGWPIYSGELQRRMRARIDAQLAPAI